MISFCRKSVHFLFNIITSIITLTQENTDHHRNPPLSGGAGLISILTNHDNLPKPNNVIESSSLMMNGFRKIKQDVAPGMNNSSSTKPVLISGEADGLASCTESLGFESCTERSMSMSSDEYGIDYSEKTRVKKKKREKMDMRNKVYPPPLTTLNENGKPVFILKPVRQDGRLQLTMVQIHRKESLRAYREGGRLRMYLVEQNHGNYHLGEAKEKEVAEEERKLPESCSGGVVIHGGHHHCHHHNMHGWGQQCVTIR